MINGSFKMVGEGPPNGETKPAPDPEDVFELVGLKGSFAALEEDEASTDLGETGSVGVAELEESMVLECVNSLCVVDCMYKRLFIMRNNGCKKGWSSFSGLEYRGK